MAQGLFIFTCRPKLSVTVIDRRADRQKVTLYASKLVVRNDNTACPLCVDGNLSCLLLMHIYP